MQKGLSEKGEPDVYIFSNKNFNCAIFYLQLTNTFTVHVLN